MSLILDILSCFIDISCEGSFMKLQNNLRVLRAMKEISQQTLADEVELSRQTVNSIERGKFNPSVTSALKMAMYFGVPVEEIFQLKDEEDGKDD